MTALAIVFMATSLAAVTALAGWCYYKVLFSPKQTRIDGAAHGPPTENARRKA